MEGVEGGVSMRVSPHNALVIIPGPRDKTGSQGEMGQKQVDYNSRSK